MPRPADQSQTRRGDLVGTSWKLFSLSYQIGLVQEIVNNDSIKILADIWSTAKYTIQNG